MKSIIEDVNYFSAKQILLNNVRQNPFVSKLLLSVSTKIKGKKVFLPAYIPYIGQNYFKYRPRILCYVINQNLSPHVPWSKEWIHKWATTDEIAIDRLNYAAKENIPLPIKPYVEGFIPLIALLAIIKHNNNSSLSLPNKIDDVISVTNFIKFSTAKDGSSSSIPNIWWNECGDKYIILEIQVLKPDIIIAFGKKTFFELQRIVKKIELTRNCLKLIECRFPARIQSNKSRPLSHRETCFWNEIIEPLINKIKKMDREYYHRSKIKQYKGYFFDVMKSWNIN